MGPPRLAPPAKQPVLFQNAGSDTCSAACKKEISHVKQSGDMAVFDVQSDLEDFKGEFKTQKLILEHKFKEQEKKIKDLLDDTAQVKNEIVTEAKKQQSSTSSFVSQIKSDQATLTQIMEKNQSDLGKLKTLAESQLKFVNDAKMKFGQLVTEISTVKQESNGNAQKLSSQIQQLAGRISQGGMGGRPQIGGPVGGECQVCDSQKYEMQMMKQTLLDLNRRLEEMGARLQKMGTQIGGGQPTQMNQVSRGVPSQMGAMSNRMGSTQPAQMMRRRYRKRRR